MSYLISEDGKTPIAETNLTYKTGKFVHKVEYAYETSYDALAQCEQLVNAKTCIISNAKKWEKYIDLPLAYPINHPTHLLFKVESNDVS